MYRKTILLFFLFLSGILFLNAQTLFVDATRPADGDGASWATAYKSLYNALNAANANTAIQEIRVAGGATGASYSPPSGNVNHTFLISRGGLKLTGGFAAGGSASPVPGQTSVLAGAGSLYHIMVIAGLPANAGAVEISGFTFRAGRADGSANFSYNGVSVPNNSGGGIAISGNANLEKIIFRNCEIAANYAGNTGAGVYIQASVPLFMNCVFWGNYADYGGAAFNYANAHTRYINCTISGNHDNHGGGGMRNSNSDPVIANTIIYGNDGGIANNDGAAPVISTSLVQGLTSTSNGNLNGNTTNPLFELPLAMPISTAPGEETHVDYRLKLKSPCINKAATTPYTIYGGDPGSDRDFWGSPRLISETIDIGAAETFAVSANGIMYVKKGSMGAGDSWANAMGELADAVRISQTNTEIKQIWVAAGTYKPMYSYEDDNTGVDKGSENAFLIVRGVKIYGGFAGGESSIGARNWKVNETILSGDLDNSNTFSNGDANHLVVRVGSTQNAILDGFTIKGAYNTGVENEVYKTVNGNKYIWDGTGGAIMVHMGSMTVNNCIIKENYGNQGGAIGMYWNGTGGDFRTIFQNCTITKNIAKAAGAIYTYGTYASFINCAITDNDAVSGINGIEAAYGSLYFLNSTLANNGESFFYTEEGVGAPQHAFRNTIFWDYLIVNHSYAANFYNCLIKQISEIVVEVENVDSYGLKEWDVFVNYAAGNYTLKTGSPAINAGGNSYFADFANSKDLAGNPRVFNSTIDLGAYEYQGAEALPVTLNSLSALIKNGQLMVNWTTETETNNDHFLIQVSVDGNNWKTVETVQSKAPGGNSNTGLNYSNAIPLTGLSLGAGFLLLGAMAGRRRYGYVLAIAVVAMSVLAYSCSRQDIFKNIENGKLFLRIVQVDKDGTEKVSKVIQVVRE
ncbi:choice-of-anchor Q domain-containing protein [Niabella drilacis]|uniref:Right handed beta helix region n=1 Tax=Niabella drilacis (strain DSM 25811 / CCM 8410 / CCUG 62505 / LMG 26954 / E90) TaxID=1285928 RepID=A0A1G6KUP1_NIADE|nr:choice-of-anchor Q domain-containing protein [Niabella drilacis]SDC34215.1 hypothetical protein SAMN04487894_10294 [Niabella drilacis]